MGHDVSKHAPRELSKADRAAVLPEVDSASSKWWHTRQPRRRGATFEALAEGIKSGRFHKLVVVCGAGISVSCGIPDFRTPGTGLYDNLGHFGLERAEDIFDISFFHKNPVPFYTLSKEIFPGKFYPSLFHYFMVLLHSKGLLYRVYSQNIDTLETVAGLPAESLVACHGSFASATCLDCGATYSQEWMRSAVEGVDLPTAATHWPQGSGEPQEDTVSPSAPAAGAGGGGGHAADSLPRCSVEVEGGLCGGLVKPNITFFGEDLPSRYKALYKADLASADCLVVAGTSLTVAPVSTLPSRVGPLVPRVLLNREPVQVWAPSDRVTDDVKFARNLQGAGVNPFLFTHPANYKDVLMQCDCDVGAMALAQACGWGSELVEAVLAGNAALKKQWGGGTVSKPPSKSDLLRVGTVARKLRQGWGGNRWGQSRPPKLPPIVASSGGEEGGEADPDSPLPPHESAGTPGRMRGAAAPPSEMDIAFGELDEVDVP